MSIPRADGFLDPSKHIANAKFFRHTGGKEVSSMKKQAKNTAAFLMAAAITLTSAVSAPAYGLFGTIAHASVISGEGQDEQFTGRHQNIDPQRKNVPQRCRQRPLETI